jgi:hypothetical protein
MRSTYPLAMIAVVSIAIGLAQPCNVQPVPSVIFQRKATPASNALPTFDRVLLLEEAATTSANASIGDINGDGNLDILLVKGRHWPLISRVLLGDGHGRFPTAYNLCETAYRSYSGQLVDIDGDGDLDVILSNDAPDPKVIYLNDGQGHFHLGSTYGKSEWEMRNASVVDLNGDGQADIVVANRTDKNPANYICLNRGKGRFDSECIPFSHDSATTITAADFNHDGKLDLAVPHRDGGQSYVYFIDGKTDYTKLRRVPFGPSDAETRMSEAADLDGDGNIDIVAIDGKYGVFVYYGKKDGTFSAGEILSDAKITPYALKIIDMNGDGRKDIVVGNFESPSTIYFNESGRRFIQAHFGDNNGAVYGLAIADLDRDGVLDIVAARSDAPNVVYFGTRSSAANK